MFQVRVRTKLSQSILSVALTLFSSAALAEAGGTVGNGGDTIEMDQVVRFLDSVEYNQKLRFLPTDLPAYKDHILPQLDKFAVVFPASAKYLKMLFERPIDPRWYFVEYNLLDVADEGERNIDLKKYVKSQIGINMGPTILIQKRLFDQLSQDEQAGVLLHEMLWTAIGRDKTTPQGNKISGKTISSIVSLLMDPYLDRFKVEQIYNEISQHAKVGSIKPASENFAPWKMVHQFLANLLFEGAQMQDAHPALGKTFSSGEISAMAYVGMEMADLYHNKNRLHSDSNNEDETTRIAKYTMSRAKGFCNYYLQGYASINRITPGSKFTCEAKISDCKIRSRSYAASSPNTATSFGGTIDYLYSCPAKVVTAVTP